MKIDVKKSSDRVVINVEGIIKTSENAQSIMNVVKDSVLDSKNIEMNIKDSFSVTSTIIGFLMQKVNVDKINLTINVGNDRLYELFDMLGVVTILNVHRK